MGRSLRFLLALLTLCTTATPALLAQSADRVRISKMTVVSDRLPDADRQRLTAYFEKNEVARDEIHNRVERFTQGMGYITAVAEQPQFSVQADKSVSVTITIHEGSLYRLADIQFDGADDFPPEKLRPLFPLNEGDRFESAPIGTGLNKLTAFFVSCGYSQVTVAPALNLDSSSATVHLTIDVIEGPRLASAVCR
jgi:outer membrane protein assembly factor BamA